MGGKILEYYSRRDIQNAIVREARGREVAVKFGEKGYGKRPDFLQYENDVLELAKQGATSFHISEERWKNPLDLKPGMSVQQLNDLRIGWDLALDVDCKFIEYSKICAGLLIEALKFHDITNIGLKFSGGSGFHICIPFESFPEKVNDQETKLLFPEGVRVIASYLKEMIRPYLAQKLLEISPIEDISKVAKNTLKQNGEFDPFSIITIDAILISSRHLFRAPYSINEKTGLASIPIEDLSKFKVSDAKIENIVPKNIFMPEGKTNEATRLIMQAFDWALRSKKEDKTQTKAVYTDPTTAIKEEFFPPCIKLLLEGTKEDGRKRAVFILTNFLKKMGWKLDDIETALLKWNQKNHELLREGYIRAQINWHRKQKQGILPPNCDNQAYYKGIGVCKPDSLCSKIRNPVQYAHRKIKLSQQNIPKSRKNKSA